jgi:hypothetical protein
MSVHKGRVAVAVGLLVIGASLALFSCKSGVQNSGSNGVAVQSAAQPETSKPITQDEGAIAKEIIEKDKRFTVCQLYNLDFQDVPAGQCPFSSGQGKCEYTTRRSFRVLKLLETAGLASALGINRDGYWMWAPTAKAQSLVGTTIIQQKTGAPAPLWLGAMYVNAVPFRWKVITGCRQFSGIDATTPLADGLKVDFSWHWKPSEVGTADGMPTARQRAVAYLKRTKSGLAIDQIQFGPETSQ